LPASAAISIVLAFLGRPLMQWVFMHSRVSEENIEMITNMFQYLQVGLSPYLASMILTRANLALRNYSLIFYSSLANVVLNIGLNVVLYARLGYVGVPLATSLTYVVIFLALYFFSRKDEGKSSSVPDPVMA
jgi:peptidoglycan biosynthesis protein MviN/MurJ (putative lipid II flippase)